MFATILTITQLLAVTLTASTATAAPSSHPVPDHDPLAISNSTVDPGHGMTPNNMRGSYYCEWTWWSNSYWWGLNEVKSGKARSFYDCAMKCCRNKYCATFDYNKKRKMCYQYNENITDDPEYSDNERDYTMGALTYKNGYSYV